MKTFTILYYRDVLIIISCLKGTILLQNNSVLFWNFPILSINSSLGNVYEQLFLIKVIDSSFPLLELIRESLITTPT